MNKIVFGKTMENVRKHRNLVTTKERRNRLMSESKYHNGNFFSENLWTIKMKWARVLINKLVYLGLSIIEISKMVMYEFWYDYVKPKYTRIGKLCYMDRDSFTVYTKIEDIYLNIAKDVETRFDKLWIRKTIA